MEDDESYLRSDYSIKCWGDEHSHYAFKVAMPSLIVWGFGIPVVSMIALFFNRNRLRELAVKLRFIYFFNGYKDEFYLWEFVI
jgi:hypothetical protein